MSKPIPSTNQPKFDAGTVYLTGGAQTALERIASGTEIVIQLLARHMAGDWGEIDASDRAMNDRAVNDGNMILSSYRLPDQTVLWIISDPTDAAGQRVTTVLLPEEY
jgi:hypothetical protein